MNTAKRKERKFWAITDYGEVKRCSGFDCGPSYHGKVWWVPECGYSMTLGVHIFLKRKDAVAVAIAEQKELIAKATKRLDALRNIQLRLKP